MNQLNKIQFERVFKQKVPNFDPERIIFFNDTRTTQMVVCFENYGILNKIKISKSEQAINNIAPHFIEFLSTNEWDYNDYFILTDFGDNPINEEIYKIRQKLDSNQFIITDINHYREIDLIRRELYPGLMTHFKYIPKKLPEYILRRKESIQERITILKREYDYLIFTKEEYEKNL